MRLQRPGVFGRLVAREVRSQRCIQWRSCVSADSGVIMHCAHAQVDKREQFITKASLQVSPLSTQVALSSCFKRRVMFHN